MFHFLRYNQIRLKIYKIASDLDLFGKFGLSKVIDFQNLRSIKN